MVEGDVERLAEVSDSSRKNHAPPRRAFEHDGEVIVVGILADLSDILGVGAVERVEFLVCELRNGFLARAKQFGRVGQRGFGPESNRYLEALVGA